MSLMFLRYHTSVASKIEVQTVRPKLSITPTNIHFTARPSCGIVEKYDEIENNTFFGLVHRLINWQQLLQSYPTKFSVAPLCSHRSLTTNHLSSDLFCNRGFARCCPFTCARHSTHPIKENQWNFIDSQHDNHFGPGKEPPKSISI